MYKCADAFVARGNIKKLIKILRSKAIIGDDPQNGF